MTTELTDTKPSLNRLATSGKSTAQAFKALANAANKAAGTLKEFRVACFPRIPDAGHPMLVQMQRIADMEGKKLVLVEYPRHIPEKVFGQTYIVYDELYELDWRTRRVVNWRRKRMVYRHEICLPRNRKR